MTTAATPATARSAVATRRIRRVTAIVAAIAANAVLWGIATLLGADFVLTDSMGTAVITLPIVAIFTAIFGLLGWGSLALLERFAHARALTIWTWLAVAIAVLSLVPIFLEGATGATRAGLVVIHLAVAAVLVPMFRRTQD